MYSTYTRGAHTRRKMLYVVWSWRAGLIAPVYAHVPSHLPPLPGVLCIALRPYRSSFSRAKAIPYIRFVTLRAPLLSARAPPTGRCGGADAGGHDWFVSAWNWCGDVRTLLGHLNRRGLLQRHHLVGEERGKLDAGRSGCASSGVGHTAAAGRATRTPR